LAIPSSPLERVLGIYAAIYFREAVFSEAGTALRGEGQLLGRGRDRPLNGVVGRTAPHDPKEALNAATAVRLERDERLVRRADALAGVV
jgi:hypothetical protein